jgi:hypothetical protein
MFVHLPCYFLLKKFEECEVKVTQSHIVHNQKFERGHTDSIGKFIGLLFVHKERQVVQYIMLCSCVQTGNTCTECCTVVVLHNWAVQMVANLEFHTHV